MDVRESEADGGVDSRLQQSSVLQQINAIQNMSQEMGEPAPWSSSSSFNSGGSSRWQPPVQASERARRDLKPSSVKSGTRIAHKIAKASIQELLLARSAMDMEEVRGLAAGQVVFIECGIGYFEFCNLTYTHIYIYIYTHPPPVAERRRTSA